MGFYIETGNNKNKADYIVQHHEAAIITQEEAFQTIHEPDLAVIVVVNNGPFEAAGFAYCLNELEAFTRPDDPRPKTFLMMDRQKAIELTNLPTHYQ